MTLTLLVAVAPSLFLLTFFYLKDRYEPEPLRHIALAFGLGLYAMIAAQGMATTAEGWISPTWLRTGGEPARLVDAFLLSGFVEELAKWVILLAAVYHWDELDEPLDGVVYGVAVALGFATLENVLFVTRFGLRVGWERALFAVPAHALFGATMGYYTGRVKFAHRVDGVGLGPTESIAVGLGDPSRVPRSDRGPVWRDGILSLVAPVTFHGLYDYALHHGLGVRVWVLISLLSVGLWTFVLRRVRRAQHASPFRSTPPE